MSFSFVGRVYSSIKGFYNEINSATLTGAIDVIIVKQEDGSYLSSPFHVRFGKLGVLRSREKVVDIEINGKAADLHMKLGEAGEAFFVQEVPDEEVEIPIYLATSPIHSSAHLMKKGVEELKARAHRQEQQPHQSRSCGPLEDIPSLPVPIKDLKSDSSYEEDKHRGKPRRKVLKKKKKQKYGANRPSPRSQSMPEGLVVDENIFEMEVSTESTEDEEVAAFSAGANRSPSLDTALKRSEGAEVNIDLLKEFELTLQERKTSSLEAFLTPFSDPEISPTQSPLPTRPPSPKSDTEVDRKHAAESQQSLMPDANATWDWGEFPKQTPINTPDKEKSSATIESMLERQESEKVTSGGILSLWGKQKAKKQEVAKKGKTEDKGMYLDDLASLEDPELARLYLGSPRFVSIRDHEREDDSESGRGASLPQSPHSVDGAIGGTVSFLESEVRHLGVVSLSLCGGLADSDGITLDKFMKKVITYDDLAEQPALVLNPDLVVKIRNQYYNWATAAPMVLSEMAFNKQLPDLTVSILAKEHMPKKALKKKTSGLSWFSWRRSSAAPEDGQIVEGVHISHAVSHTTTVLSVSHGNAVTSDNEGMSSKQSESSLSPVVSPATSPPTSVHSTPKKSQLVVSIEAPSTGTESDNVECETRQLSQVTVIPDTESLSEQQEILYARQLGDLKLGIPHYEEKYFKTLRLTSEQIAKLNLREGPNEIVYSVTTQYQGTTRCMSHIYLWNYDDKIVISDIDGTITKSDVLGQILPIIGRDWSQSGVAQLFTRLSNNGYKFVYLSARAIGQSRITKDLLKSIKQGDRVLPDGPLLLNPTSLISAFHREVIVKNPEEFKINCLKDIADLFPACPFYAGFGNKINDVIAYRALCIPGFRIFTINPQGQLRHDLSHTFLSSYAKMSDIADHFFPPINCSNKSMSNEYSNVNYWRNPMPEIDQLDLERLSIVDETLETKTVTAVPVVSSAPAVVITETTAVAIASTTKEEVKKSKR